MMAEHGNGYPPSHCWYYRTGGRILDPKEIKEKIDLRGPSEHHIEAAKTLDRRKEPRRSRDIKERRDALWKEIAVHVLIYMEQAKRVEYRRRWLGPWPDQDRDMWSEPFTAIMLKHNHLCYCYSELAAIDQLGEIQDDLF